MADGGPVVCGSKLVAKTYMNQKTLRAPVAAPKGVSIRAAAIYPDVPEGRAVFLTKAGESMN
jgi:hypothetical protein